MIAEKLRNIRTKYHLTQEEMAEKLFVTRQAVSRWENGETEPGIESLKLISKTFDLSINTLLGHPRALVCQCCGMPMEEDAVISRESDQGFNEDYCKWCYEAGHFTYQRLPDLIEYLAAHFSSEEFPPEQARAYYSSCLSQLKHWKGRQQEEETDGEAGNER